MTANRFRFRAWNTVTSIMLVGVERAYDTLGCMHDTQGNEVEYYGCSFYDYLTDDEQIVMQSTGLTDKNGKEIFEGDVVRFYGKYKSQQHQIQRVGFVRASIWAFRAFDICQKEGEFEGKQMYEAAVSTRFGKDGNALEVIGNIYENPEQLK